MKNFQVIAYDKISYGVKVEAETAEAALEYARNNDLFFDADEQVEENLYSEVWEGKELAFSDNPETEQVLYSDGDADYILKPEHSSVWITVGNISVHVIRTDSGCMVELLPVGCEMVDPAMNTCFAEFEDAAALISEHSD